MYSKGCGVKSVNEARNHLHTTGQKSLGNIPPTQAALYEHVKWAIIQVSFIGVRLLLFSKIYPISVNGAGIKTAETNGNPYGLL